MPRAIYNRLIEDASSALSCRARSNPRDRAAFAATVFKQQQIAAPDVCWLLVRNLRRYWLG
ncbi:hypothetical protein, partial [Mesorhizobium sp.]|uniref:hypothetical protein n=1 Tax=Mesorhizobium sp. TaxID=1871066 RepID=UPI00257A090C